MKTNKDSSDNSAFINMVDELNNGSDLESVIGADGMKSSGILPSAQACPTWTVIREHWCTIIISMNKTAGFRVSRGISMNPSAHLEWGARISIP